MARCHRTKVVWSPISSPPGRLPNIGEGACMLSIWFVRFQTMFPSLCNPLGHVSTADIPVRIVNEPPKCTDAWCFKIASKSCLDSTAFAHHPVGSYLCFRRDKNIKTTLRRLFAELMTCVDQEFHENLCHRMWTATTCTGSSTT